MAMCPVWYMRMKARPAHALIGYYDQIKPGVLIEDETARAARVRGDSGRLGGSEEEKVAVLAGLSTVSLVSTSELEAWIGYP
jgi:hypothetical protein